MSITETDIQTRLQTVKELQPSAETLLISDGLPEWRLSYGQRADVFFIAMYPAFCSTAKATFHYTTLSALTAALNEVLRILSTVKAARADVFAALFALSRGKESFELFQEQRELMVLGLKSIYLDNFYQDKIKSICMQYYQDHTLFGMPVDLHLILPPVEASCV